jgi:serine/threonine protein kinase
MARRREPLDNFCKDKEKYKGKFLGGGVYGKAYDLNPIEDIVDYFNRDDLVVKEIILDEGVEQRCKDKKVIIGKKNKKPKQVEAFFCEGRDTILSEYLISLEASSLNTINMIETIEYKNCNDGSQFIFMEKIDGTIFSLFNHYMEIIEKAQQEFYDAHDLYESKISNSEADTNSAAIYHNEVELKSQIVDNLYDEFDAIIIQILHALWCLHSVGINHNDSKLDNIFYIEKSNMNMNGKSFDEYDYAKYDFGKGNVFYIPMKKIKYIIKLGDFGLSSKFSEPYILSEMIYQKWSLDYLSPLYDLMLSFNFIHKNTSDFYKTIQAYLIGFGDSINLVESKIDKDEFVRVWKEKVCKRCNDACPFVNKINYIVDDESIDLADLLLSDFDTVCEAIYFNRKDGNKDRRQIYNFLLSDMAKSPISVDHIIKQEFFQVKMKDLGWFAPSRLIDNKKVYFFGGPGYMRGVDKNSISKLIGEINSHNFNNRSKDEESDSDDFYTPISKEISSISTENSDSSEEFYTPRE